MLRSARYAPGGLIYHALNRAVARLPLFRKPADYAAFERVIEEAHERVPLDILSYCLMPNHWYFLLRPRTSGELTDFLRWPTHTHTMRWHAHHHTAGNGHLYQGRFKAFPVEEDEHFYSLSQNRRGLAHFAESSEQNVPVPLPRTVLGEAFTPSPATSSAGALRAGLVDRAEAWRWSSLWRRENGDKQSRALLAKWPLPYPRAWLKLVNAPQTEAELAAVRAAVHRGSPLGGDAWERRIVKRLGLESTLRPRGRPRNVPE